MTRQKSTSTARKGGCNGKVKQYANVDTVVGNREAATVNESTNNTVTTVEENKHEEPIISSANEESYEIDNILDNWMEERQPPIEQERALRMAIAFVYINVYKAADPSMWEEMELEKHVRDRLGINNRTNVQNILHEIYKTIKQGFTYTGDTNRSSCGQKVSITVKSVEAQILADCLENGQSLNKAMIVVNTHCSRNGVKCVSKSVLRRLIKEMKPIKCQLEKKKQGSRDKTSKWARARMNWVTYLLVQLGKVKIQRDVNGNIPEWFDEEKVAPLELQQIVWWDETHQKCVIGNQLLVGQDGYFKFPRSENGEIDIENGQYKTEGIAYLSVKYDNEIRLALGCAMVLDQSGVNVGQRCKPLVYSNKVLVSINEYEDKIKYEIQRVRQLTGERPIQWVTNPRLLDTLYSNDDVQKLKGCGKKTREQLVGKGIATVGDLKKISPTSLMQLQEEKGLGSKVKQLYNQALDSLDSVAPELIDHRKTINPYESKYGEQWQVRIKTAALLSSFVCITDLVEHIVSESAKAMQGTSHKQDWVFYHDALSLMTAKDTVAWMKSKDFYKRWLLPPQGMQAGELKVYDARPTGDSPEMMPWDATLNNNLKLAVKRHVALTKLLPKDEKRKFNLSTPAKGTSAFLRLVHPDSGTVPSSCRIVEDIQKVVVSMIAIYDAQGIIVDFDGVRSGKRQPPAINETTGSSTKKCKSSNLHPDVLPGIDSFIEGAKTIKKESTLALTSSK